MFLDALGVDLIPFRVAMGIGKMPSDRPEHLQRSGRTDAFYRRYSTLQRNLPRTLRDQMMFQGVVAFPERALRNHPNLSHTTRD